MAVKLQELRCDKQLINSNFEGYKLSLSEIPGNSMKLPVAVRKLQHVGDHFSYLYLALFSMHNHLSHDPWNENVMYYVNENFGITRIITDINGSIEKVDEVLLLPKCVKSLKEYHYNAAIIFASHDYAVVSDGDRVLRIVYTGVRTETSLWKIEYSDEILEENITFLALDARCVKINETVELHCLLTNIVERTSKENISNIPKASTDLIWIIFKKGENKTWTLESSFKMNSSGASRYAYIAPKCEAVFIESAKSLELVEGPKLEIAVTDERKKEEPQYYWQQSTEDIKMWFALPRGCSKKDVEINITEQHVNIAIKGTSFLVGSTFQRLNADLTTWDVTNNRVEIILWKHEDGQMWRYLIVEDNRGEEIIDPELVKEIHKRLAHLCSEHEALSDDTSPPFNSQQLEACDHVLDEDSRLVAVDRSSKKITHEVLLSGYQKLFNVRASPQKAPYMCIRRDVDGTLWNIDTEQDELCKHVGTLNAFGYVHASKQCKYSTCSPDLSYAVIATTKQNVFVYKQYCNVNGNLRNRKTGHKVANVGKQFLINLNCTDEILGLHASNDFLFVLTRSSFFVHCMKNVE